MPVINDAVVVNSAYNTIGNSGRKLVQLSNGWFVAGTKNATTTLNFYVDRRDGNGFVPLCFYNGTNMNDYSIVSKGTNVYVLIGWNATSTTHTWFNATTVANVDQPNKGNIDLGQTALGNVSLAINDAETELHATWSSKNSSYSSSYNIRYAKGTIATDGNITWSSVEQRTTDNNSAIDNTESSIVLHNEKITIVFRKQNQINSITFNGTSWGSAVRIVDTGYQQSSPSTVFVPKSINGLAKGRIWATWHGLDGTDTTYQNIRCSYSDDDGINWISMQKLTSGNSNSYYASITADKSGKVFIVFSSYHLGELQQLTFNGTSWGVAETIKKFGSAKTTYPSTALGLSLNMSIPLFIYNDTAKVGIYGSWTDTKISVPSGYLGEKYAGDILPYSISTDGTMSTITEKINDVVVATKTAISGESLRVLLTDAQWDAMPYGRYRQMSNDLTDDFSGKVAGDLASNPHISKYSISPTLLNPSAFSAELVKEDGNASIRYSRISTLNGDFISVGGNGNGYIAQSLFSIDLIEFIKRKYGVVVPGVDIAEKVKWLKANVFRIICNWHGFGVGPSGNKASLSNWRVDVSAWAGPATNTSSIVSKLEYSTEGVTSFRIDSNGFIHFLAYAEASNGTIASAINTDYINIVIQLKDNAIVLENTLTIEMGTEKWAYTFSKQLTVSPELGPTVKAILDNANISYPAKKSLLTSAIRDKGGTVSSPLVSLETMIEAVKNIPLGRKSKIGTVVSSASTSFFQYAGTSASTNSYYIAASGLGFKPSYIIAFGGLSGNQYISVYSELHDGFYQKTTKCFRYGADSLTITAYNFKNDVLPADVSDAGFLIPVAAGTSTPYTYIAIE